MHSLSSSLFGFHFSMFQKKCNCHVLLCWEETNYCEFNCNPWLGLQPCITSHGGGKNCTKRCSSGHRLIQFPLYEVEKISYLLQGMLVAASASIVQHLRSLPAHSIHNWWLLMGPFHKRMEEALWLLKGEPGRYTQLYPTNGSGSWYEYV